MKLNVKLILIGGLAYYAAQWIVGFPAGMLIHEGILTDLYSQTTQFWRPELNQVPPDMAALMPRWITVGLIAAFIATGIYDNIRSAFNGSGLVKGIKFGFVLFLLISSYAAGLSGVFILPEAIWFWWAVEGFIYYLVGGAVLGWVAEKVAPESG